MSLAGKVAVVTGASSGIGQAIALACANAGADLVVSYQHNRQGIDETVRRVGEAGRVAVPVQVDISREADVERLSQTVQERFGRVDVWINNAGADILTGRGAKLSRAEKLELLLAVDVRGTVVASWAAVGLMRAGAGGVILNMSWDHVTQGMKGENPILYSVAKGAIASFSRSLAREVAPSIRVNILAPGFIETAFGEEADPTWREEVVARTPMARWGVPEDVAQAAVFLASDAAGFLTGQTLAVNGGVVM
ncbi:MAG TPA: SDR family oxidoreductase [Gemmatimonadales bacterium]|nr:SDR family oxidoreductase [Gemmatimonadales bacterium]